MYIILPINNSKSFRNAEVGMCTAANVLLKLCKHSPSKVHGLSIHFI